MINIVIYGERPPYRLKDLIMPISLSQPDNGIKRSSKRVPCAECSDLGSGVRNVGEKRRQEFETAEEQRRSTIQRV